VTTVLRSWGPCGWRLSKGADSLLYITAPIMVARPIPMIHPDVPSERSHTRCSTTGFTCCSACSFGTVSETVSFAAISSAFSASIFFRRASAPLRPASCFLGSFCCRTGAACIVVALGTATVGVGRLCASQSIVSVLHAFNECVFNSLLSNALPVTVLGCGQRGS